MNVRKLAALAVAMLALGLIGCSGSKESQREDEVARAPAEPTEPMAGVVTSVDGQRIILDVGDSPGEGDMLFERTTRSLVIREGREASWEDLHEGDAVRVMWDRGVFGPDRAARVEVLEGDEAEQVRREVEGDLQLDDPYGEPMGPREIDPGVGSPSETLPPPSDETIRPEGGY